MEPPKITDEWSGEVADDTDNDYRPARAAFHEDQSVCDYILGMATAAVPFKIAASQIASPGSGLFVTEEVEEGQELFHSQPPFICVFPGESGICHYCLRDAESPIHPEEGRFVSPGDPQILARACMGCNVAKFCSKDCQKRGWRNFHKDECKILKEAPSLLAKHLLVYRILFSQKRNGLTSEMGKALLLLENHFSDYSDDSDRATDLYDTAMWMRATSGTKMALRAVWRLVPAVMTNAINVRSAHRKMPYAVALDLTAAVINHSCNPNAFVFFEGGKAYVRSLREISAGEEITVCYMDPTTDVNSRNQLLKEEHFFDCYCNRCNSERTEHREMLDRDTEKLSILHQAQKDIVDVVISAIEAARRPGFSSNAGYVDKVETSLRKITSRAFSGKPWPAHIDPLPTTRMAIALLYLYSGNHPAALRKALKGVLARRYRSGPEWVNVQCDLVVLLLGVAGGPETKGFDDAMFPTLAEIQRVILGFALRLSRGAGDVFGLESKYTSAIGGMYSALSTTSFGAKPGTKEFGEEFDRAQAKLLAWAGMEEDYGIKLD